MMENVVWNIGDSLPGFFGETIRAWDGGNVYTEHHQVFEKIRRIECLPTPLARIIHAISAAITDFTRNQWLSLNL
jgi:hypothetical protein